MKEKNYLRLMTAMIAEMHQAAAPKADIDSKFVLDALYANQDWAIRWENEWLLDHEENPAHVEYVVDVLSTWRFVEREWSRLDDEGKAKVRAAYKFMGEDGPKFEGFDGNNEGDSLGVARILIETMGRFDEFEGRDLNSHSATERRYSLMNSAYKAVMDRRGFAVRHEPSADDLIEILTEPFVDE